MKLTLSRSLNHSSSTKTKIIKISAVTIALVGFFGFFALQTSSQVKKVEQPQEEIAASSAPVTLEEEAVDTTPKAVSPLSGMLVNEELANKPVSAVMVENSPDARPQSGLDKASVVFEAVAEGGITRFVALYQSGQAESIGPIRSMRPYFVDIALGFDASLAHIGGSPAANEYAPQIGLKDNNLGVLSNFMYRDDSRFAPHNAYSSTQMLDSLNVQNGFTDSDFSPWKRKPGSPSTTPTATYISVPMSSYLYNVTYDYNSTTNSYDRNMGGGVHNDKVTGKQLSPSTVIIMNSAHSLADDQGRMNITTTGSNTATIFQNGTAESISWHRTTPHSSFSFTDYEGKSITINSGQTWIHLLPNGRTASY